jgi:hypothetical protein
MRCYVFGLSCVSVLLVSGLFCVLTPRAAASVDGVTTGSRPSAIRVETKASSWRNRGRVSFALEPSVRMKLARAGIAMAPPEGRAEAVLSVDYREERAEQVTLDIYGTELHCELRLEQADGAELFALMIKETPAYGDLSTLPYVDVVQRLETNPYFYFLGELVTGALTPQDPTTSLVRVATRYAESAKTLQPSDGPYPAASETLPSAMRPTGPKPLLPIAMSPVPICPARSRVTCTPSPASSGTG